jgi:hypothetical protein
MRTRSAFMRYTGSGALLGLAVALCASSAHAVDV